MKSSGALYYKGKRKLLKCVDRNFKVRKTVRYCVIGKVDPQETTAFSVHVAVPKMSEVFWGRGHVKYLDRLIQQEGVKQKIFLVYDTKLMDERTRDYFKDEGVRRIRFLNAKDALVDNQKMGEFAYVCEGGIKDTGSVDLKNIGLTGRLRVTATG